MNNELSQKLNYLLLGEEKYTECPHIVSLKTEENGILITEECGGNKEVRISYEEILNKVLNYDEGKKVVSEIIKEVAFNNR